MTDPKPMHRRWVGSLLSLLLPGAGIFLAGDRKSGVRWFVALTLFGLLQVWLAPMQLFPGLVALVTTLVIGLVLLVTLLVRSFRPVPSLGLRTWITVLLLAVAVQWITSTAGAWLVHPFSVPAASMEPTIQRGDHLLVQKYAYWFSEPKRGDIVVFRTDEIENALLPRATFYIKRVAALPGEELQIVDGQLRIAGKPIESPAILAGSNFAVFAFGSTAANSNFVTVVPKDAYFLVGDNGTNSFDSRYYGPVPRRSIIGQATKTYWPYSRGGDLR